MAKVTIETKHIDIAGIAINLEKASSNLSIRDFAEARLWNADVRAQLDRFDALIDQQEKDLIDQREKARNERIAKGSRNFMFMQRERERECKCKCE